MITLLDKAKNLEELKALVEEERWAVHDGMYSCLEDGVVFPSTLKAWASKVEKAEKVVALIDSLNSESAKNTAFKILKKLNNFNTFCNDPKGLAIVIGSEMALALALRAGMKKAGMIKGVFAFGLPKKPGTYTKKK